ncbi:hypothetical protein [Streptomyces sp. NPDC014006]|uniref:hypothetical protein n=1 Tax=Streptomyces sp. NPDC014006 TaxID=3364870 RepID=UPI0036FF7C91
MHARTAITALSLAALAVTGCSSSSDSEADSKPSNTPSKAASSAPSTAPSTDNNAAERAAGIPPKPTGAKREELLRALAAANPDVVKYEDKAIDAARNQCAAINGGGSRLDYFASQRFTYKDVMTTEAQGKQINEALKASGSARSEQHHTAPGPACPGGRFMTTSQRMRMISSAI